MVHKLGFVQIFYYHCFLIIFISVELVCQSLPDIYVDKLLSFIAGQIESSRHIEFYLQVTPKSFCLARRDNHEP